MTPQELRDSIILLAMEGKLVGQRAQEGSAKQLIEAIVSDRKQKISNKVTKENKKVEPITEELGYNLDQCGYPHIEEEILDPMDLIQRYQEERASLNAEIDRVLADITAILGGGQE